MDDNTLYENHEALLNALNRRLEPFRHIDLATGDRTYGWRLDRAAASELLEEHDKVMGLTARHYEHVLICRECYYLGSSIQTPCSIRVNIETELAEARAKLEKMMEAK